MLNSKVVRFKFSSAIQLKFTVKQNSPTFSYLSYLHCSLCILLCIFPFPSYSLRSSFDIFWSENVMISSCNNKKTPIFLRIEKCSSNQRKPAEYEFECECDISHVWSPHISQQGVFRCHAINVVFSVSELSW